MEAPSPASGGRDFSVQNLGLGNAPSGVITGLAKRRQCWAHQAASLLASLSGVVTGPAQAASLLDSPSSVVTGPAKRRKCWARRHAVFTRLTASGGINPGFLSPPSGLRPPSPASGGRDFPVQNLGLGNAPSGVNAGFSKRHIRVLQHISTAYTHHAQR